jgi:hypothetical protein
MATSRDNLWNLAPGFPPEQIQNGPRINLQGGREAAEKRVRPRNLTRAPAVVSGITEDPFHGP